jgi:D-alanine-D-alanine ligase-like ATP-grasp enzyme
VKRYYTTEALAATAAEMGAEVHFQPDTYQPGGFFTFAPGNRAFFLNNQLGVNPFGAFSVVNDKHCATALMRHFGYRVPEEVLLGWEDAEASLASAAAFAHRVGFPLIVKPRNMSQGHLVTKVESEAALCDAAGQLFALRHHALVQRFHAGDDHRIVVFDGEIVVAYVRRPPAVTGDGVSTVADLLGALLERFGASGRNIRIGIDDPRIRATLTREGLEPASILPVGRVLRLLDNANMASGGSGVEVTAQMHPGYAELCIRLCRDFDLRLGGVDLLTADITLPVGDHVILELNASPGIRHFASLGAEQDRKARDLYRRLVAALAAAA